MSNRARYLAIRKNSLLRRAARAAGIDSEDRAAMKIFREAAARLMLLGWQDRNRCGCLYSQKTVTEERAGRALNQIDEEKVW